MTAKMAGNPIFPAFRVKKQNFRYRSDFGGKRAGGTAAKFPAIARREQGYIKWNEFGAFFPPVPLRPPAILALLKL
jgi:hypothetical protein